MTQPVFDPNANVSVAPPGAGLMSVAPPPANPAPPSIVSVVPPPAVPAYTGGFNMAADAAAREDAARATPRVPDGVKDPILRRSILSGLAPPALGADKLDGMPRGPETQGPGWTPPGGLRLLGDGLGGYSDASSDLDAFYKGQIEKEKGKRGGFMPAVPEKEQRTGFTLQASKGPDMGLVDEQEDVRLGRELRVPEEPPPSPVTGSDILSLFQPPEGTKDPKAWAEGEAARIRAEGGSVRRELELGANGEGGLTLRQPKIGKAPKNLRTGEEIDAWEAAERQKAAKLQQDFVDALDGKMTADREMHAKALAGDRKAQAAYVAKYGEGGLVGSERRKNEIAQELAEERAGYEERSADEEAKHAARMAEIDARAKKTFDGIDEQIRKVSEDAAKGVDRGKFWREKSMGDRFGIGLAVFASAIGAGLTGQANGALAQLDKAMDRDLEEQRRAIHEGTSQRLTVLQQLYKNTLQETGDEKASALAMRISALEEYKRRMLAFAEKAGKKELRESALAAYAQAKDKQLAMRIEMSERIRGTASTNYKVTPPREAGWGGGPDDRKLEGLLRKRADLAREGIGVGGASAEAEYKFGAPPVAKGGPKSEKPEMVMVGGRRFELTHVTSTTEGSKARERLEALDALDDLYSELKKERSNYAGRAWDDKKLEYLSERITNTLSAAEGQGVTRDAEMARALKALTGWKGSEKVIDEAQRATKAKREFLLRQAGAVEAPPLDRGARR